MQINQISKHDQKPCKQTCSQLYVYYVVARSYVYYVVYTLTRSSVGQGVKKHQAAGLPNNQKIGNQCLREESAFCPQASCLASSQPGTKSDGGN